MAGRDRYLYPSAGAASSLRLREAPLTRAEPNPHPHPHPHPHPSRTRSSVLLEDRIEIQHREIQSLLVDNQRLAVTHVALKEELTAAKRELQLLLETAAKVKAERDAQGREVYQRSLKMEAEVRVINVLGVELDQVRADVQKFAANRQELAAELAAVDGDLVKLKSDSQRVTEIKAEIETVRQEIQKGRAAIELEKKTHASNLHYKHIMGKSTGLLAREIEKLRGELANAENKARTAAAACPNPGYAASYGTPDMVHGGIPYTEPYGMHQVHGGVDCLPQQAPSATQHAPYDVQQSGVQ